MPIISSCLPSIRLASLYACSVHLVLGLPGQISRRDLLGRGHGVGTFSEFVLTGLHSLS